LPALVLLRKPLFGLANRHIQPERYAPVVLKLVLGFLKGFKSEYIGLLAILLFWAA
jgi:hypothetical protein